MANGQGLNNLIGGFLQGYAATSQQRQQQQIINEIKKTQIQKLKAEMDEREQKLKYADIFQKAFETNVPLPGREGPPAPGQGESRTFAQALQVPGAHVAGLRSGLITPKDIGLSEQRQLLLKLLEQEQGQGQGKPSFTQQSKLIAAMTGDPTQLKANEGEKVIRQMPDGPHNVMVDPVTEKIIADLGPVAERNIQQAEAAKINLGMEASKDIREVLAEIVDTNGNVNKTIILQMAAPGGGVGRGRALRQKSESAIVGQLLTLSGVSARPEEKESLFAQYIPSTLDLTSTGLVQEKLQRFINLLEGNLDYQSLPPSLLKRINEKRAADGLPPIQADRAAAATGTPATKTIEQMSDAELRAIINGQ